MIFYCPLWSVPRLVPHLNGKFFIERTMRRNRFSEEQIIAILAEQELGLSTAEVYRRHGISSATFYNWKRPAEAATGRSGTRQDRAKGSPGKRLTTPQEQREAAFKAKSRFDISQRRACRLVSVDPKTVRRERAPDHPEICERMREIAAERRRLP